MYFCKGLRISTIHNSTNKNIKHMKKLFLLATIAISVLTISCTTSTPSKQVVVYPIDELCAQADSLIGDTVCFEGICTHICSHGGRKAFLMGSDESKIFRVEGASMGKFDATCINQIVRVTGIVRALDIAPQVIEDPAEKHGEDGQGCKTEEKAIRAYYADAIEYTIVTE